MTPAQKWARERNGNKFRLDGISSNIVSLVRLSKVLTREERRELTEVCIKLKGISKRWKGYNEVSKKKYLRDEK